MPETPMAEPHICSIRCKSIDSVVQGHQKGKRRRDTVNGTRLERFAKPLKGKKIVVEVGEDGKSPACETVKSLLVHEIGSCVREQVPMNAPRYSDLPKGTWKIVFKHLSTQFDLQPEWLQEFIKDKIQVIFRAWKCQCHTLYKKMGAEAMPVEFNHRPEQWQWLVAHFKEPKQKALCINMQGVRINSERIDHHSGKVTFAHRAERHYRKGAKAGWVDAIGEVYGPDPRGAVIAAKMKKQVHEFLCGTSDGGDPLDGPLPVEAQMEIIDKALGKRKGTGISGMKRPPLPRGRPKQAAADYFDLEEQLKKKDEEQAKRDEEHAKKEAELEERIRALEARFASLLPGGSSSVASDGASFGINNPTNH